MLRLFVVPPSFRVSHNGMIHWTCRRKGRNKLWPLHRVWRERAYATVNGVEAYTLLALYRLMRGIHFLPIGTLAATDVSSLRIAGKGHVSCMPYEFVVVQIIP